MARVLRPGGLLLLADHIVGSSWPVRAGQRLLELVTVPLGGEHFRRRPLTHVQAAGLRVERRDRFKAGIVERLAARKPLESTKDTTHVAPAHAHSPEPRSSDSQMTAVCVQSRWLAFSARPVVWLIGPRVSFPCSTKQVSLCG